MINFNILVYYYFKTKQTKQNRQQTLKIQTHPSARQTRTNEVQTQRSLEIVISLQYYKGKPLSFKAAIVTSLIDLSTLIPSGGFKYESNREYCLCIVVSGKNKTVLL